MSAALPLASPARSLAERVQTGERAALARALNLIDDRRPEARRERLSLLCDLPTAESRIESQLIGLTGPPGAGKSTLISALIGHWRAEGHSVAVLAADPSSPHSGGALLGDRLRMQVGENDQGVFIRSLASRETYGGLAAELLPMAAVLLNGFDRVIVETVGVGQREVDIAHSVDTTCLAVQPGAGDSIQFLKAGVMEIPDVLAVTKSDLGTIAIRTHAELMASAAPRDIPVVLTSAHDRDAVASLARLLDERHTRLVAQGELGPARRQAQARWLADRLREEFGRYGLERLGGEHILVERLRRSQGPLLARLQELRERVLRLFDTPRQADDPYEPLTF